MGESTHKRTNKKNVSATQISRANAVCEDCGRKWTATLAEVPVTVFTKDLDDNFLEAVDPPMVLCVFRPSDRNIMDTEVILSCVAPRQDTPHHWRISHKEGGPVAASGCHIIPWRDKNFESKSKYSSSEPEIVTIKEEIKVEDDEEIIEEMCVDPLGDAKDVKPEVISITVALCPSQYDATEHSSENDEAEHSSEFEKTESSEYIKTEGTEHHFGHGITDSNTEKDTEEPASEFVENFSHSIFDTCDSPVWGTVDSPPVWKKSDLPSSVRATVYSPPVWEKTDLPPSSVYGTVDSSPVWKKVDLPSVRATVYSPPVLKKSDTPSSARGTVDSSLVWKKSNLPPSSIGGTDSSPVWEKSGVPPGWEKRCIDRSTFTGGVFKRRVDMYYKSPKGKILRSKNEVVKYCQKQGLDVDLKLFGFPTRIRRSLDLDSPATALNSPATALDSLAIAFSSPETAVTLTSPEYDSNASPQQSIQQKRKKWQPGVRGRPPKNVHFNMMDGPVGEALPVMRSLSPSTLFEEPVDIGYDQTLIKVPSKTVEIITSGITNKKHKKEKILQKKSNKVKKEPYFSQDKPWTCEECGLSYSQKTTLDAHKVVHTGEKPYTCTVCNQAFAFKSNVVRHMLIHTGVQPYSCDICSTTFTQSADLKRHYISHSGIKPFQCDMCNYACTRKHNLELHKYTHTGETPFKCDFPLCDAAFSRPRDLRNHKLQHDSPVPHTCKVCGQQFTEASALKRHMLTHTDEKPYTCDQCDKTCIDKSALKRHMFNKHMKNPLGQ